MNVELKFEVSAQDAVRAGLDTHGEYVVQVRPSEMSELARAVLEQLVGPKLRTGLLMGSMGLPPVPPAPTTETAEEWIERIAVDRAAEAEARRQRHEVRIAQAVAMPDAEWIDAGSGRAYFVGADGTISAHNSGSTHYEPQAARDPAGVYLTDEQRRDPRIAARRAQVEQGAAMHEARERFETNYALWQAAVKAHEQAEASAAAAVQRIKHEWLGAQPVGVRKRHARGLLPDREIIDSLREQAYAPLGALPRLQRISDAEVLAWLEDDDEDREVAYTTRAAQTATDAEIERMDHVERVLAGAECELIEHVGYLAGRGVTGGELTRRAIRVTLRAHGGAFTFTREYESS